MKNQSPWPTCWSFADIATSETSILSTLRMTAEEYREKYGEDMDLSEKVESTNEETLDIFEPGMYNLLDASAIVIDAILAGTF